MTLAGLKGGLRKSVTTFRSHQPPRRSLQSVPIPNTCNMSLVTFHKKICYNTATNKITVIACQVRRSIQSQNTLCFCLSHTFVIAISCNCSMQNILKSEHILLYFLHDKELNTNCYFVTHKSNDKIKCPVLHVECLLKILFTQMWHNTSLCKNFNF